MQGVAGLGSCLSRRPRHAAQKRRRLSQEFLDDMAGEPLIRIATISGRYYAMDRDKRWERIAQGLCDAGRRQGQAGGDAGRSDRSLLCAQGHRRIPRCPRCLRAIAGVKDGDGILFANFRADRVRQILRALLLTRVRRLQAQTQAQPLPRRSGPTDYAAELNALMDTLFPPEDPVRHAGRGHRRAWLAAAAHRRDRKIRPCHLLLEWRPRGRRSRARIASSCRAPRSRPMTCSPRCRRAR